MPPIDTLSIRVPGEMDRCLSHIPDVTSRHVGCRSALNVSRTLESSLVARDSFATCCDASDTTNAVLFEKDTVTTLEDEPNNVAHLPQDTLLSHNVRSADLCSSQKEFDSPAAPCDRRRDTNIMNHRNRHSSTRRSDAMRYFHVADAFSITRYGFNQILGLMMTDWITNSSWRRWRIYFPFLICLFCATQCTARTCAVGLSTPGWTWPQGDIVIKHGKPLRMFCLLNQTIVGHDYPGKDAGDLRFFRNDQELESEFVTVINETTIELFIKAPPASDDMYNCKLKINSTDYIAVCLNKVVVGYSPQKPKNFDCVSYNWENINCTWEPEHNFVHTTYDLMFQLPGRLKTMYYCPLATTAENSCMWDIYSDPIYRQPYSFYIFILNVTNAFGHANFTYRIQHYPNVIPAKPFNLTLINKTSDSALLYWELPFPMATFPVGVHHKIMYQHQWDHEKDWKVINITHPKMREQWLYNLTGLEYANTVYDVRIYLKSSTATRPDRWSDFSVVTFRTSPKLPGAAPRTDIGSFEITENNGNRDVYLYWQAIPQNQENGNNFKYQIIHVEDDGYNIKRMTLTPSETTRTYAKLKGIGLESYLFEIISVNEVGSNTDRARIYIPNQSEIPRELIAFTKIAFENGLYELSWKPPFVDNNIMNYTIFWCDNERDRPYQCTGYLDWVHVSKNTTIYNITVPDPSKVYQFAISVNTERGSSGMIWSSCTVIHNKVLGKMKSVWINRIGSHFIEVGWKLDCSDRIGIIEGFNIYYCPILSPLNVNCKGPMLNRTMKADAHTIHGVVDNLTPYTTYMLNIAVLTKSGEGLRSDPLYNTTLEAAPSTSPLNVRITDVSNTTMFISWKKPMAMNGVLRYYEVYYNDQVKKVEEERHHIKLTGLKPYTEYSIRVSACTVKCSEKSIKINEYTKIGVPGKISIPLVRFVNSSQVIVQWDPPQEPAGPVKAMYYEIEYGNGMIQNVSKTEVQLPIPDCKNVEHREQKHKFRVRAINVINCRNEILKGTWSDFGEGNCYNNGLSYVALVIIWMVGVFSITACIACLVYMFKRMWIKCRAMRDVEVKLPPGLAPDMKLLEKISESHIRQPSADSSGCSSGQESVTSSLTAESQVCSDSGTEVDAVHTPSDKLKGQPVREMTHLRQRSTTRVPASLAEVTPCWESYIKVGDSGEAVSAETLSLARSTPNLTDNTMSKSYPSSQHGWSSANYISMPSSSEALLSNPSLIPRKNADTTGDNNDDSNSSKDGDDNNDSNHGDNNSSDSNNDSSDDSGDALIPIKFQDEFEKEKQELTMDEPDKMRSIIELNKKRDILSHINPDKTTMVMPYVQAGLIDEIPDLSCIPKHIQARNSNLMCGTFKIKDNQNLCKKEYMPFSPTFPINTTLTSASPKYIFASIIPEGMTMPAMEADQKSLPQKTLHDPYNSTTSETSYNLASSAHEMQPQEQQEKVEPLADVTEGIDESGNKDNAVHPALSWPTTDAIERKELNSSYITIADLSPPSAGPSYVRLEKMPLPQTATSQSDEQYTEVTVVPSTVQ